MYCNENVNYTPPLAPTEYNQKTSIRVAHLRFPPEIILILYYNNTNYATIFWSRK